VLYLVAGKKGYSISEQVFVGKRQVVLNIESRKLGLAERKPELKERNK
jgi:hypothetical protein